MSALRMHLWKEWREHRAVLLVLLVAIPLLLAGPGFLVRPANLGNSLFITASALLAVLATLLAVGGELLGAERRGNGLHFLQRLPGAIPSAFRAKRIFFGVTTLGAALYAYAIALLLARCRGVAPAGAFDDHSLALLLGGGVVALWTFAVSPWAQRGGLSVLCSGIVVFAVALPGGALVHRGYQPARWEILMALTLLVAGALISARAAFVPRGLRGRGRGAVAAHGLLVVAVVALPVWGDAAFRFHQRAVLDPLSKGFSIDAVHVTANGSLALAIARQARAGWNTPISHVLSIDLETGTWEVVGGRDAVIELYGESCGQTQTYVVLSDGTSRLAFDAATGEPTVFGPEDMSGGHTRRAGLGCLSWRTPFDAEVFDPFRQRTYPLKNLGLGREWESILILPGRWLVQKEYGDEWSWLDPDTGVRESTGWPTEWSERIEPKVVLPDGRLLLEERSIVTYGPSAVRACLLDPATGSRDELIGPDEELYITGSAYDPDSYAPTTFSSGPLLLLHNFVDVLQLDAGTRILRSVPLTTEDRLLRSFEDGTVLLVDEKEQIVRVDLETGERRVLFPLARP